MRKKSRKDSKCPEYKIYIGAKDRCRNPKNTAYKYYGARGIKFLFRSFTQFMKCLGPRPEGMSIDRINNDGHYKPGNVRWATCKQQGRNKRGVKLNEKYAEEIITLKEMGVLPEDIARAYNVSTHSILAVLSGRTWGDDESLDEPIKASEEEKKYIEILAMFKENEIKTKRLAYCA